MKTDAFKTTMNGGVSTGVWSIDPAINDGYPYLNTQPLLATNNAIASKVDIQVTPTQADSYLRIITPASQVSYEIVDFSGRVSRQGNATGTQKEVNVSSLLKGVYFINVKTEKGNKSVKFIKK